MICLVLSFIIFDFCQFQRPAPVRIQALQHLSQASGHTKQNANSVLRTQAPYEVHRNNQEPWSRTCSRQEAVLGAACSQHTWHPDPQQQPIQKPWEWRQVLNLTPTWIWAVHTGSAGMNHLPEEVACPKSYQELNGAHTRDHRLQTQVPKLLLSLSKFCRILP